MFKLLQSIFFLLVTFHLVYSRSCVPIRCSSPPKGISSCSRYTDCVGKSEFSSTSASPSRCQCLNVVPSDCTPLSSNSSISVDVFRICETSSTVSKLMIPPPRVANEGRKVITVVVDRFFESDSFRQTGASIFHLHINARFAPAANISCVQQPGVEIFVYTNGRCLLRSKVAIPGMEYTSDNNYYYDDKTPLESAFSRDFFFGAKSAEFWLDASRLKMVSIPGKNSTSIYFRTMIKSPTVNHAFIHLDQQSGNQRHFVEML